MQPTPPPPEGGRWAVGCFRKMAVAPPPHRRGPVGTTPRTKNNILNRLQESNYTPYACLGTTYGTEISSRSQPCHRLDQKTEKNAAFWQKRPKMARFGVHSLFGPRPLPISPRAGVESKKGAKCDIIRRQDAKKGVTKAKKTSYGQKFLSPREKSGSWVRWLFSLKEKFSKTSNPKVIYEIFLTLKQFELIFYTP